MRLLLKSLVLFGVLLPTPTRAGVEKVLQDALQQNGKKQEMYSTNAICRQNNCVNPVFPGLEDLAMLETFTWQCQDAASVREHMQFCRDAVNYDVAVPSPNTTITLQSMVQTQEKAAATMYFYHLAGINMEAWDHKKPSEDVDPCVRAIWLMTCHTYFPRSDAGCKEGMQSSFVRPCKNVCQNYIKACNVECCDESAKCVFETQVATADGTTVLQTGYVDQLGPSASCTGAATRTSTPGPLLALLGLVLLCSSTSSGVAAAPSSGSRSSVCSGLFRLGLLVALLVGSSIFLQGCDIMGHDMSAWENKPSYVLDYQFIPETPKGDGAWQVAASKAVLNSCHVTGLPKEQQCNGNGFCKAWGEQANNSILFCECDRDWADPECRTRRKSQAKAFVLALLGGWAGLDRFYLGEYYTGCTKLATLGGLGIWWLADIVRTGSAPIYASGTGFRLAADLPHWLYVLLAASTSAAAGYYIFGVYGPALERRRRVSKLMLQAEDQFFSSRSGPVAAPQNTGAPTRASFGVPMPTNKYAYGTWVPREVIAGSSHNVLSSFNAYEYGISSGAYSMSHPLKPNIGNVDYPP